MRIKFLVTSVLLTLTFISYSQHISNGLNIVFYNVENLFDTIDDPTTSDEEFTPDGGRYWTNWRFYNKISNISKVILSSSGWDSPAIIGLCEVENRWVLEKLVSETPLKTKAYKIIHKESPDHRGIDVALLYDPGLFYPLTYRHIPLKNKNGEIKRTREILYVRGVLNKKDTIHIYTNHWPSRYGGLLETKAERNKAARALRHDIDTILLDHHNPKIIILGDFNDQPEDESLMKVLRANPYEKPIRNTELYNLSYNWVSMEKGTLKYRTQWSVFDQIIVSGSFINSHSGYRTGKENASIVNQSFLYERDERYGGTRPWRTYYGYKYLGGFSDHLPVLLKLTPVD